MGFYGQAYPIAEPASLRVDFDAEDMAWLRQRQLLNWQSADRMIDLPTLVKAIVKEARIADVMAEKAEAAHAG